MKNELIRILFVVGLALFVSICIWNIVSHVMHMLHLNIFFFESAVRVIVVDFLIYQRFSSRRRFFSFLPFLHFISFILGSN